MEALAELIGPVPARCDRFARLPLDARDEMVAWNQLLSLAACVQSSLVVRVSEPGQLDAMMDDLVGRLAPSVMIYLGAIEYGPDSIRLRAAYQIAAGYIALITRARSSIVTPSDPAVDRAATQRARALHAELESALAPVQRLAWEAFEVVARAAAQDPHYAPDIVTRNMVRAAHRMLDLIRETAPTDDPARASQARPVRGSTERVTAAPDER